jgi:hypothetical protein
MIYSEHLLNFLRAAVSRLATLNIYLTSFLLLFQDDLQTSEHLLNFLRFKMTYNGHFVSAASCRYAAVLR